ncbi:MAG: Gfo/Idh/MocA family oxidoreductase [Candidatus Aenigmarchaeota archaeon]|nr:Gfo/Idh/MocA family oxidoreductase [Candidatus Aenigmarchaeota archaeon]
MVSIVQIGYGNAARIHRDSLKKEGIDIDVLGVIEINPNKIKDAEKEGFKVFRSIDEYFTKYGKTPDFFDNCTPTKEHYWVTKKILEHTPDANILIEKPVTSPEYISLIRELIKYHPKARISVNENYISSNVTRVIKEKAEEYGFSTPEIDVEFTKNRVEDVLNGRFIDKDLGALGYEGSHELAVVRGIFDDNLPDRIEDAMLDDMVLPDGTILKEQGSAEILFDTNNGCKVDLFSSMIGKIKFHIDEFNPPKTISIGEKTRYRIISLAEGDIRIIGQFEPVEGYERGKGRVYVSKGDNIIEKIEGIRDNNMGQHIKEVIKYFNGEIDNPSPVDDATVFVKKLCEAVKIARSKKV